MYDRVPTNELAMESMSMHETPKSHSLISPRLLTRMFDGLTSEISTEFNLASFMNILSVGINYH